MKEIILAAALSVLPMWGRSMTTSIPWYQGPSWSAGSSAGSGYGGFGVAVGGGGFGTASTPESAAGHAIADMIRAEGAYNAMTAEAMKNVEDARGKYIQNQREWTDVYLLKQRALAAEHARAKEEIRARNALYLEDQANHPNMPPRLVSSQLDRQSGEVDWPSALMRDAFVVQRSDIEELLTTRAREGATSELSMSLVRKTREMQDVLRDRIHDIVVSEYLEARKFLDSLALEGLFPVQAN